MKDSRFRIQDSGWGTGTGGDAGFKIQDSGWGSGLVEMQDSGFKY
jgi:hypothetical protein